MCNACIPMPTHDKTVDEFADQLLDMLNQGALSLMVSIGHRTGLFDAMSELSTASLDDLAAHSGLHDRYIREWLGAMVSGGIVCYDASSGLYHLPDTHACLLTRSSTADNIAVYSQYISVLGQVEDRIVECFRDGGGVGYEHYPRFHEVMAEDSGQTVLSALDDHILPLLGERVDELHHGISVLDIGCGRGRALLHMAERFPNSQFTGYELSREAVSDACTTAGKRGLENISFEQRDLTGFRSESIVNAFDLVMAFDAIHDQIDPQSVLDGIYRTLKPAGIFLMQDIRASSHLEKNLDHPIAPLLYTLSTMHCMSVSLAGKGAGLGTMWGEELALEMLGSAGFEEVEIHQLEHDFQNNFYIMRKTGRGD